MGLHPAVAAVRQGVRRALTRHDAGHAVLVACSGGADSLALLSAAVFEGRKQGLRVIGVTVDHGLQEGSAEHAARVVQQMAVLGVDETAAARVQVDPAGLGMEAAARRARYDVLEQMRAHFGAVGVLLGHTRDDQAETVLLGLARGSGARSIAGMRRAFDHYERPLLDVARADTVAACLAEGIEFWDDPHNADPGYARVRVRQRVLPVLEDELGPGIAATLARTADQVRADVEALDALADAAYQRISTQRHRFRGLEPTEPMTQAPELPLDELDELLPALATRVLRLAALAAGARDAELFHVHVTALHQLAQGAISGEVQLPGHVTAYRDGAHLCFRPTPVAG
ncbi:MULTISPECIES: tRNA lysidine(34) synthetase TilS [unclassified Nocardioides]|uniref:tRNA lysidine(34) synthetase TilS n=1 Tax=unclassified Nocardioides TaxID=2615069 RepID=UPI0007039E34|nr:MULTISPECIES: tRNA lysidine(34) synthetase TilS [unclassified Nocardioides]KRC54022.1 tRNA(Ile)-lysidine synthetase [Nocardioides sp. Root79]KRC71358.1 tRNA(Ile)-lysidine synthetase [Nocardioides sp. Root240]